MKTQETKIDQDQYAEHRAKYAQFVTEETRTYITRRIGLKTILATTDPRSMNDIPLAAWDNAGTQIAMFSLFTKGSMSQRVCLCKEAALQVWERNQK